jgi:hypothetical protein
MEESFANENVVMVNNEIIEISTKDEIIKEIVNVQIETSKNPKNERKKK